MLRARAGLDMLPLDPGQLDFLQALGDEPCGKAARQAEIDGFYDKWLADVIPDIGPGPSTMQSCPPAPQQLYAPGQQPLWSSSHEPAYACTANVSAHRVYIKRECSSNCSDATARHSGASDHSTAEAAALASSLALCGRSASCSGVGGDSTSWGSWGSAQLMQPMTARAASITVPTAAAAALPGMAPATQDRQWASGCCNQPPKQSNGPRPVYSSMNNAAADVRQMLASMQQLQAPQLQAPQDALLHGGFARYQTTLSPSGTSSTVGAGRSISPPQALPARSLSGLTSGDVPPQKAVQPPVALPAHAAVKKQEGKANGAAAAAPPVTRAIAGGRGRRGAGLPAKGALKDTTRRKAAEIIRLEQEVQQKLSLAADLERQKEGLERRERLLKLQVSTGERRLRCHSMQGMAPHMKTLIQGFRASVNQVVDGMLLDHMPQDPKKITIREFIVTWQGFVHEIAGLMMEGSCGTFSQLEDACERALNWIMAICIHSPAVVAAALNTNMQTGEERVPPIELWAQIVHRLDLSEQQVTDLQAVCGLYSNLLQRMSDENTQLMVELSSMVDRALARGNPLAATSFCNDASCEVLERQDQLFQMLEANDRQWYLLHTMLFFLVFSIFDNRQRAIMIFRSFPSFPNLKLVMAVVSRMHAPSGVPCC